MFHLIPYRNINNSQLPLCHEWHWRISWKKMQKWCITKNEKCFQLQIMRYVIKTHQKNVIWPNIWSKNIFWSKIWQFVPNLFLCHSFRVMCPNINYLNLNDLLITFKFVECIFEIVFFFEIRGVCVEENRMN